MSIDDDFYRFLKMKNQNGDKNLNDSTSDTYYHMFLFFKKYFPGIDHDQILDNYIDQCYKKKNESLDNFSTCIS